MMFLTVQRMAQMYRDQLGIGIPHPLSKICHMAEFLGVHRPCPVCPFDFACSECDANIERIYNEVVATSAN